MSQTTTSTTKRDPLIMTRAEHDLMTHEEKQEFRRMGGTVTENPDYPAQLEARERDERERLKKAEKAKKAEADAK